MPGPGTDPSGDEKQTAARPPRGRRTTLADVAERAGVSRATASRALADDPRVRASTADRVREAAEALEYVPNLAAQGLRARRTRALGLLLVDLSDPVHGQVAAGFQVAAAEAGYSVIIVAAHGDPASERRAIRLFVERATDGICVASITMDPADIRGAVAATPLSLVQPDHESLIAGPNDLPSGTVRTDDASGIRQAIRHLVTSGRRDVMYLGSGDRATDRSRHAVAAEALRSEIDRPLRACQVGEDAWMRPDVVTAALPAELPDSIVCYDDKTALALLDGLRSRGLTVPDDVAVVGFDDIPFARLSNPRLTTVSTPSRTLGELGARVLVRALAGEPLPEPMVLPVRLVERESSAPPRPPRASVGPDLVPAGRAADD